MQYNVDMFWISSIFAKIIFFLIKIFKFGNGYTLPGHLAQKIYPDIWRSPTLQNFNNIILVSGTNGKTTTAKLITHLLVKNGFSVISNASGANLVNGLLSSLLVQTSFFGRIQADLAVFEVDELNLPLVLQHLTPKAIVLTNLSRDQLDRYGEVDNIFESWKMSLEKLSFFHNPHKNTLPTIFINSDFPKKAELLKNFKGKVLTFDSSPNNLKNTSLVGKFNALNVNAAVLTATQLGLDIEKITASLASFSPAFGRGEVISYKNTDFYLFLAKNPASFNNNLELLVVNEVSAEAVVFILNDNIPDGRDVSWIYDIDSHLLKDACFNKKVFVSGNRALDMEIRLFYAGIPEVTLLPSLNETSLENLIHLQSEKIAVLPNYSAMLDFRKLVTGRNIL